MKHLLSVFGFLFFTFQPIAAQQLIVSDDFNSGSFPNDKNWQGETEKYSVQDVNGALVLRLNAAAEAGTAPIFLQEQILYGELEFSVYFLFSGLSSSNKINVYFGLNQSDLDGTQNGYLLSGGESGTNDVFKLYRVTNGSKSLIGTDTTLINEGGVFRVRIRRDTTNTFTVSVARGVSGTFNSYISVVDSTHLMTGFSIFEPVYTSTRSTSFAFDDIRISKFRPFIRQVAPRSPSRIDLIWSESVSTGNLQNTDFSIQPLGINPDFVEQSADTLILRFSNDIPFGNYTLIVAPQKDSFGIESAAYTFPIEFKAVYSHGDVIINEFMHNPPAGLVDYVELKNTSAKNLDISNWIIRDNKATAYLVPSTTTLEANSYLVLSADTSALFSVFGDRNYVELGSFPGFNNTSTDQVRIFTDSNVLVDSLQYSTNWGGSGVALERRSALVSSVFQENWGPSPNVLKGTPGLANEISPDQTAPELLSASVMAADTIILVFSEKLDETSVSLSDFSLSNSVSLASIQEKTNREWILITQTLLPANQSFTLSISNISDLFGNEIFQPIEIELAYYETEFAEPGDILISEFMYDPPSGYSEFIELYNNSDKFIDLNGFTYADNSGNHRIITENTLVIQPQNRVVIAPNANLESIFPGLNLLVMGTGFASLNNSGDQIVIRSSDGELMDSLEYNATWGGSDKSLERRSFAVSSIYKENWGDSPNPSFATPGLPNEVPPDTLPPVLNRIETIQADSILLQFSERLNKDVAENLSSYYFPNELQLQSARLNTTGNEIGLRFSSPLNENTPYSATILQAEDLFGNSIQNSIPIIIEYVETQPAEQGDLVISEFMYDPPSGYSEFIELYNQSEKVLDLMQFTYSDNAGKPREITDVSTILKPHSFLILAPNDDLKAFFPNANVLVMGSGFHALNNTTDQIVIKNNTGQTLDSLAYTSDWGGSDRSLERRSYTVSAVFKENWGDSPSPMAASVGAENGILPDVQPPQLLNLIADAQSFTFIFDEQLDENHALNVSLSVSPSRVESSRTVNKGVLNIKFTDSTTTTTSFTVSLGSVRDIFGNLSTEVTQALTYVLVKEPESADIFITEFVYRSSETTPEFVEIFNASNENIDLKTLEIADNREEFRLEVLPGFLDYIKPHSYIAITTDEGFAATDSNRVAVKRLPSFNNSGGDAIVVRYQAQTLDSVHYQFPLWPTTSDGQSLERKQLKSLSFDPANWGLHPLRKHSAGKVNLTDTLIKPLQISFAGWLVKDTLTIITSRFIANSDFLLIRVGVQEVEPVSIRNNTILVALEEPENREAQVVELKYVESGFESTSTQEIAYRATPETSEPLIITEILFNPLSTDDGSQSEFIELFNPNPFSLIVPDNFVQVESLSSGSNTSFNFETFGLPYSIPSNRYLIVYPDTALRLSESRLGIYFSLDDSIPALRTNRNSLSLSSTNSAIKLYDSSGALMDSVHYLADWHNPNVADVRGRSLERVLLRGLSNDATNWSTSGNPLGATPGKQNSNFIEPAEAPKNQLVIFPNPFSPDEDGFEDNTTISWNLDGTNYVIDATIYDRFGRKVRTLAQNVVAGKTGSLVWNGKRDDGTFNRIGIYIILFKATDTSGGKSFIRKESIVIARKM